MYLAQSPVSRDDDEVRSSRMGKKKAPVRVAGAWKLLNVTAVTVQGSVARTLAFQVAVTADTALGGVFGGVEGAVDRGDFRAVRDVVMTAFGHATFDGVGVENGVVALLTGIVRVRGMIEGHVPFFGSVAFKLLGAHDDAFGNLKGSRKDSCGTAHDHQPNQN